MMKILIFTLLFCLTILGYAMANEQASTEIIQRQVPPYLYKVLSLENWQASQSQINLHLSQEDEKFIHLATKEQLNKITEKFWSKIPEFVILKIDTHQLQGRLVFENNPGGTQKYYYLYDGSIPLKAIVEAEIIRTSI